MAIGTQVQKLRNEKKMSALDLAKQLNKSESTIRMWESNNSKPDIDALAQLAEIFDCSTDYLLGLSENRNISEERKYEEEYTELIASLKKVFEFDRLRVIATLREILNGLEASPCLELYVLYLELFATIASNMYVLSKATQIAHNHANEYFNKNKSELYIEEFLRVISETTSDIVKSTAKIDERYKLYVLSQSPQYDEFKNYEEIIPILRKFESKIRESHHVYANMFIKNDSEMFIDIDKKDGD